MGWRTTFICLINNLFCEKYFNNFLDLSEYTFSYSEPTRADSWLGFLIAPARARYRIPLNAVYLEF